MSSKLTVSFGFIICFIITLEYVRNLPNNIVFKMYFKSEFKERELTNRDLFVNYLSRFNKSYEPNEFFKRFRYFKKNLKEIARRNAATNTATYGLTKFSDRSPRELARMLSPLGGCESMANNCTRPRLAGDGAEAPGDRASLRHKVPGDIAQKLDWREHRVVGPILNQKECPVCWAFSIAGVMESMAVIQDPRRTFTRLSIQELIDCSFDDPPDKTGCTKGRPLVEVFEYLCRTSSTLAMEEEYPLTYDDESCKIIGGERSLKRFNNRCDMYQDEERLVEALQQGPVTATVDAFLLFNYIGGIISENCKVPVPDHHLNHAVQIVGYDKTGSVPYYIVRNSWGEDWGESGYVKVGIGGNQCGIAYSVGQLEVF